MIPLSDDNPTVRPPVMTILVIAAIGCVWVLVQGAGFDDRLVRSICNLGLVPGELTKQAVLGSGIPIAPGLVCAIDENPINWWTPVLSMFLHGGWGHLLVNLLFFWVFGNNVEDVMGAPRFLLFYLVCGLAAAGAHVAVDPASPVPTVGASGAISGMMGAYLVLFPRVRVRMLFLIFVVPVRAWAVLIWWLVVQVLLGLPQLGQAGDLSGGVAAWAHIGGFLAGALLVRAFEDPELTERRRSILLQRGLLRAVDGV
ncbi:MAG: rhomboid family intramembrane serine protease [Gemmatimonadaceae bacterium]